MRFLTSQWSRLKGATSYTYPITFANALTYITITHINIGNGTSNYIQFIFRNPSISNAIIDYSEVDNKADLLTFIIGY